MGNCLGVRILAKRSTAPMLSGYPFRLAADPCLVRGSLNGVRSRTPRQDGFCPELAKDKPCKYYGRIQKISNITGDARLPVGTSTREATHDTNSL